ncbi:MAG: glycosyl hydrolase family 65 protein [Oscillospiraceae bacterium]|nr:glycosyl hydrolase family 65 protein [Oscillospiraceae bacterium]
MWKVIEKGLTKDRIELNGSKFLLANGYMGYRGTLEEHTDKELAACVLSGLYDRFEDKWREPVNAPNGFYTKVYCDGVPLFAPNQNMINHVQSLDIRTGVFERSTTFAINGKKVTLNSQRFLSADDVHLMCLRYSVTAYEDCYLKIETGIDGEIWDINGPHLKNFVYKTDNKTLSLGANTIELNVPVYVSANIITDSELITEYTSSKILAIIDIPLKSGQTYQFDKMVSVYTGLDTNNPLTDSLTGCCKDNYNDALIRHKTRWEERWKTSDVVIDGDKRAQLALRYSIYHLMCIAPHHSDRVSIPARGLSGQVYKGAVFWDTEMFMLRFFILTQPEVAKNLIRYRINTLNGARRKAAEYGYKGAFFAWESQDTGDDACTLFNITDVFTNRPMRTYFRDKQVHISADVAFGIWEYYLLTGDKDVIINGGAETILECARFFLSYAYYKPYKHRYEILDVTGPDEYHERVNNNAFTNKMVEYTLKATRNALKLMWNNAPDDYDKLIHKLGCADELAIIDEFCDKLYIPQADKNGIIEQFDSYHSLEDVSLKKLKEKILNPNEYLGGGNGLATTTKILKQADVVLMLTLFSDEYSEKIKKANFDFYEPRTEHGSSLSSCIYSILASDIGDSQWGYEYFLKTAEIDLNGSSKQYVGDLYIGGTHPAANGGAWMATILGFGGVRLKESEVCISPRLPESWNSLSFCIKWKNSDFRIEITKNLVSIAASCENKANGQFNIKGSIKNCSAGDKIACHY